MRTRARDIRCAVAAAALGALAGAAAAIPEHPDQISFPPLSFDPPRAEDSRYSIDAGGVTVPVYLAPSHEFPLVNVVLTFRGGAYLDPADRVGLAAATAAMTRRGGTTSIPAEELDEEFDFLAARVSVSAGGTRTRASLNSLASNFDESFGLFFEMLRRPGFEPGRLKVYKEEQIEQMKQRNDHPASILRREWEFLVFGRDHFEGRRPTGSSIESISIDDLRRMHARVFHPGNLVIAANGDFEPQAMLRQLEQALQGWPAAERVGRPPAPQRSVLPGLYHLEKDIPQGRVILGLRSITRDHPDYFPVVLMNEVLGGGGFTSRIVSRVRSDEGLAYSAGSTFAPRVWYPGPWYAAFQSKNRTVALALKIILEEVDRIRDDLVPADELQTAKNALIETFPQRFESKAGMLAVFVDDELTGRDSDYWDDYRAAVQAVTPEDLRRVARIYLRPDEMAMLVVGPWEQIAPGDLQGRASMAAFFGGHVTHLPLRDPLTLK